MAATAVPAPVTAERFRSDRYLRATGYNFYVWAAVNLLVTVPLFAVLYGRPWPPLLTLVYVLAVIACGIVGSGWNDRRVERRYGAPDDPALVGAGSFWLPLLLLAVLFTVVFVVRGPAAYIQPLWLLVVGTAYWVWGNFGVWEFRWFGATLVAAGTVTALAIHPAAIPTGLPSRGAVYVWVFFMGILWIPFGAYINRKYVHAA